MKKLMKRWISSLAVVLLLATVVLNGNDESLKKLIIPEADACSCSHFINTGSRVQNAVTTVHTINATVFDEQPPAGSNMGNMSFTYGGSMAAGFVITEIYHTTSASAVWENHTVTISNIPPTNSTSVFQIRGYFTNIGSGSLFVSGSNLMSVTNGVVDGGNCNSISGTIIVTAPNVLPNIFREDPLDPPNPAAVNDFPDVPHNDIPGQTIPSQILRCTDPDIADTITAFTVVGNVTNLQPVVGLGTNSASITFDILNPDAGGGPALAVFTGVCQSSAPASGQPVEQLYITEFTNAAPTLEFNWGACDGTSPNPATIGKSLADLRSGDNCNASGTATPFDDDDTGLNELSISGVNPIAVTGLPALGTSGVDIPVTISTGPLTGSVTEMATVTDPHGLIGYGEFQIGPKVGGYSIFINFGDTPDDTDIPIPPTVYYVSEIDESKRRCKEVAYSSTGEFIAETEYGDLVVTELHGSSENPPSTGGPSPHELEGFDLAELSTDYIKDKDNLPSKM